MSDLGDKDELAQSVQVLQIIIGAMVLGASIFLGVTVFLRTTGQMGGMNPGSTPFITYAAMAVGIGAICVRQFVTAAIVRNGEQKTAEVFTQARRSSGGFVSDGQSSLSPKEELMRLYATTKIVGGAMLEGPTLFVLIAYLLEGSPLALGFGILLIVGLAMQFPMRPSVDDWMSVKLQRLQELGVVMR